MMTESLLKLPEVIFRIIQTFLSNDDYHYFLNSSKIHLAELKRRTIFFSLNEESSERYLEDQDFQSILLSEVEDGWRQIRICSKEWLLSRYDLTIPNNTISLAALMRNEVDPNTTTTIPILPRHVKELEVVNFSKLKDVSNLANLAKLYIAGAMKLKDILPLRNIANLTIKSCDSVADFSVLTKIILSEDVLANRFSGVHILHLIDCPLLSDVSCLRGIHDLKIESCRNFKDISGLGGHYRLSIISLGFQELIGYESLVGIPHIYLQGLDIADLSVLQYAQSVKLNDCLSITNITPIKNAKTVELIDCACAESIIDLCEVSHLVVKQIFQPIPLSDLMKMKNKTLEIEFPSIEGIDLIDKPFLAHTEHLTLFYSSFGSPTILKFSLLSFQHLLSITIEASANEWMPSHFIDIDSIQGLADIPTVRLLHLRNLSNIGCLGRNRCVELRFCPKISDVSSLSNVSLVTIEDCEGILDYSVLMKVPRLKIMRSSW